MKSMAEPIITCEDVSFFYADQEENPGLSPDDRRERKDALEAPGEVTEVFNALSVSVPPGVTSLVGQNGSGKSTFLLLAGARLFPATGTVTVLGRNTREFEGVLTRPDLEEQRNRYVSFVYQNMEFETEEPIGTLLEYVYYNGFSEKKDGAVLKETQKVLELEGVLGKKTQELSKGQLQRAIIGFSLLYGSTIVMMDEPVFALEEPQKRKVFSFLTSRAHEDGFSILYSAHNLDLTRDFSDNLMLFGKDGSIQIGPTAELFTRERIEQAYQVPFDMLHQKEHLFREMLARATRRR